MPAPHSSGRCSRSQVLTYATSAGSEMGWTLDGGRYNSSAFLSYRQYAQAVCLAQGAHTVVLRDSYGDGWQGGRLLVRLVLQAPPQHK